MLWKEDYYSQQETFHFSIISQRPIISLIEQNTNFQEKIEMSQASF